MLGPYADTIYVYCILLHCRFFGLLFVLPRFKGILLILLALLLFYSQIAILLVNTDLIFQQQQHHLNGFTLVADLDEELRQANFNSMWDAVRHDDAMMTP